MDQTAVSDVESANMALCVTIIMAHVMMDVRLGGLVQNVKCI